MVHKLRHRRWRQNEGKRMGVQEVGRFQKWDVGERWTDESTAAEDGRRGRVQPWPRGAEQQAMPAQGRALAETTNSGEGAVAVPSPSSGPSDRWVRQSETLLCNNVPDFFPSISS